MVTKWKTASLKQLGVQLIDCDHKTPKAVENGVPYIGIPQMNKGRVDFDAKPRLISEEDFVTWTRKANPKYGDVILSRRCNSGETAYVPQNSKFALGQNLVLLRPEGERIHPEYLRWAVQSSEWWNEVAKYLNPGAIFESLKCADIPKFEIPEPPKSAQIKIAEILSAISDKIELNQQTNQTLEHMAQALFKSWFVDFDPVFDNMLAKVDFKLESLEDTLPEELVKKAEIRLLAINDLAVADSLKASLKALAQGSPPLMPQHATTHAHFPSELELNEQLGWIPKDWDVQKISSFSEILNGFAFKSEDYVSDGNFVLRTKNFKDNQVKRAQDDVYLPNEFMSSHHKYLSEPFDYHLVMVGASVGKCAIIYPHNLPALRNQNMWCFRAKIDTGVKQPFVKYMLDIAVSKSLGLASGSAREFFRKGDFGNQEICTGTNDIQYYFDVLCSQYLVKMGKNSAQIETLTKLRDTLLPKLISGELQIPDLKASGEKTA